MGRGRDLETTLQDLGFCRDGSAVRGAGSRRRATVSVILAGILLASGCYPGTEPDRTNRPSSKAPESSPDEVIRSSRPVIAVSETETFEGDGDQADDPAIWERRSDPAGSLIIGTSKGGPSSGLHVYGLDGKEHQYLPVGDMNNVDVRYGFGLGSRNVDLVGATNRSEDTIDLFEVVPATRRLRQVGSIPAGIDVYGFCMYRSAAGTTYAFVNSEQGEVEQYRLRGSGERVTGRRVRSFQLEGPTEGCVADDEYGRLYVGEEGRGVWRYGAEPDSGEARRLVDEVDSGPLEADVEGVTIYRGSGDGYLIVSSQGSDSFAVYERDGNNTFVGAFTVVGRGGVDAVTETDGLDVSSLAFGPSFPEGLLVVHDHSDRGSPTSNFKLIGWSEVAGALGL